MSLIRMLLVLAWLVLSAPGSASASTIDPSDTTFREEKPARDILIAQINSAIAARNFAALDAMEADFSKSRARIPSGFWKLDIFHGTLRYNLGEGLESDAGCRYLKAAFVADWRAANRASPAAIITDAALLKIQASCIRGGNYASNVPDDDWSKFHKLLDTAANILEKYRPTASVDPEFYATEIEIFGYQGRGVAALQAVVEQAVAREPDYHPIYTNAAWFMLPQWGGSYPLVDQFAQSAAERTRNSERSGLYARVYRSLEECGCYHVETAGNWPMMKQAMRDLFDRYPTQYNGLFSADLACKRGDGDEGRRYIRALHPEATSDDQLVILFTACDDQARPRT